MNTAQTRYTYVRAKIDANTKARAADVLAVMGLSFSDAIRLFIFRVADEKRLPFAVKRPNATTRRAIAELEAGGGYSASTVQDFMAALNEDD